MIYKEVINDSAVLKTVFLTVKWDKKTTESANY